MPLKASDYIRPIEDTEAKELPNDETADNRKSSAPRRR